MITWFIYVGAAFFCAYSITKVLIKLKSASRFVPDDQHLRFWGAIIRWLVMTVVGCTALVFLSKPFIRWPLQDITDIAPIFVAIYVCIWLWPQLQRLGNKSLREWNQLSCPTAERAMSEDHRPPIVYLRCFQHDGLELPSELGRPGFLTYEVGLFRYLRTKGPCIAIGRPGEVLPELGAARLYVEDEQWESKICELLNQAQFVVISLSNCTANMLWELEYAFRTVPHRNILLMFPWRNDQDSANEERQKVYETVREKICKLCPFLTMPEHLSNGVFILFGSHNEVIVVRHKEHPKAYQFEESVEFVVWRLSVEQYVQETARQSNREAEVVTRS